MEASDKVEAKPVECSDPDRGRLFCRACVRRSDSSPAVRFENVRTSDGGWRTASASRDWMRLHEASRFAGAGAGPELIGSVAVRCGRAPGRVILEATELRLFGGLELRQEEPHPESAGGRGAGEAESLLQCPSAGPSSTNSLRARKRGNRTPAQTHWPPVHGVPARRNPRPSAARPAQPRSSATDRCLRSAQNRLSVSTNGRSRARPAVPARQRSRFCRADRAALLIEQCLGAFQRRIGWFEKGQFEIKMLDGMCDQALRVEGIGAASHKLHVELRSELPDCLKRLHAASKPEQVSLLFDR